MSFYTRPSGVSPAIAFYINFGSSCLIFPISDPFECSQAIVYRRLRWIFTETVNSHSVSMAEEWAVFADFS